MDGDVVVSVENVSKKFCRSLKRGMYYAARDLMRDTLGMDPENEQLRKGEMWAVQDVSFDLRRGESIGIVGANGAGKSTLLKMINGILRPDTGRIRLKGRISALIEVGAGFHPMLSGRENIYINGAIMGMSKREIDRKFDAIVDFSGLETEALDVPVKMYSSGMYARLGFAVASQCEPDILLVDEVLAVGDLAFQSKCFRHIHWMGEQGTVMILVTHFGLTIRNACRTALWLEKGRVQMHGDVDDTVSKYEQSLIGEHSEAVGEGAKTAVSGYDLAVRFHSGDRQNIWELDCGDPLTIEFHVTVEEDVDPLHLLIDFQLIGKELYTSFCTETSPVHLSAQAGADNVYRVQFPRFNLPVGEYLINAVVARGAINNHLVWSEYEYRLYIHPKPTLRGDMDVRHDWYPLRGALEPALR